MKTRAPRAGRAQSRSDAKGCEIRELALIRAVRSRAGQGPGVRVGIGDDCAVLEPTPRTPLLATTDLLIENVHFRRTYSTPADIGWKAFAVNLSDIASMGGRPRWALVALACPPSTDAREVEAFYAAAWTLADEHEVTVVGGDTSASPSGWIVNVTLLGEAVHPPLLRSTARVGDVVGVTGPLGRSAAGLTLLIAPTVPVGLTPFDVEDVTRAHLRPVPRVREGQWLAAAGGVSAMIDLSDGLVTDLAHLAEESAVGARIDLGRLPLSETVRRVATACGGDALAWATSGGEDYELLFTCRAAAWEPLARGLEGVSGRSLHAIGEIVDAAQGVTFLDADGHPVALSPGFEHFTT
jgi:thiamine-monophosphate kinase